jgi:hypothetical protein
LIPDSTNIQQRHIQGELIEWMYLSWRRTHISKLHSVTHVNLSTNSLGHSVRIPIPWEPRLQGPSKALSLCVSAMVGKDLYKFLYIDLPQMKGIVDSVDLSALGLLLCFQISTLSLRPAAPDVHVRRAGKKNIKTFPEIQEEKAPSRSVNSRK